MPKRPPNDGKAWTAKELKQLEQLAKRNTPTREVASKLGRTPAAVQQKASTEGISFRSGRKRS
jgi:hypothetical protein